MNTQRSTGSMPDTAGKSSEPGSTLIVFWLMILALIGIDAGLSWKRAMPSESQSDVWESRFDTHQRLAAVQGRMKSLEVESPESWPFVQIPAAVIYSWGGVSHLVTRFLPWAASVMTLLALGLILSRRFDRSAVWLALLLFTLDPLRVAFVEVGSVLPWVALWCLGIVAAVSRRSPTSLCTALVLLALGTYCLDPLVALCAPTVIHAFLGRSSVVALKRNAFSITAGLTLVWGICSCPGNILEVLLGVAPGIPAVAIWAFTLPVALLGSLLHRSLTVPFVGGRPREDTAYHVFLWTAFLLLVCSRSLSREPYLMLLPAAAYSIAFVFHVGFEYSRRKSVIVTGSALRAPLGIASVVSVFWLWLLARPSLQLEPMAGWGLALAGLVAMGISLLPADPAFRRWILIPVGGLLVPLASLIGWNSLGHTKTDPFVTAASQLEGILLPSSTVGGQVASALTVGSSVRALPLSSSGDELLHVSHLLVDRPSDPVSFYQAFASEGISVEAIEEFHVGGRPLLLFRLAHEDVPRSLYEEAMAARARGDYPACENLLLELLEVYPELAPAWTRLGQLRLIAGDNDTAFTCFLTALQSDPNRVQAHVALSNLYQDAGYEEESRMHLEAALRAEPGNTLLRREIDQRGR